MLKMNLYDWCTADLIHSYVENHYDDFCEAMIDGTYLSELEYVEQNFIDFRDWAEAFGYEIET